MLNKIDVDMHLYKKYKDLIDQNWVINSSTDNHLFTLCDKNERLIAVAKNQLSVKDVCTIDKFIGKGLSTWEMKKTPSFSFKAHESWKFRLDINGLNWVEDYQFNSIEELDNIILINQKVFYLDKVYDFLNSWYSISVPPDFQQNIYFMKYLEVKNIIENNIIVDETGEYPHTSKYAELKNISLQQSAKEIKFQYDNISNMVSDAEFIRLKYKKLIVNETDIKKLNAHYEDLLTIFEKYGHL